MVSDLRRRFGVRLATRAGALIALSGLSALLLVWGRAPTAALVTLLAAVATAVALWRLVERGNTELARFLDALERGDLSQGFAGVGRGAGFGRLADAYERALDRLRRERSASLGTARFAEALIDGAPIALLVADFDGTVHFENKAARRLFGRTAPCAVEALIVYGAAFARTVADAPPGPTRLTHLALGGPPQRVAVDVTLLEGPGQPPRRILAVKVIQAELDGAELAAQVDLVRVLSHEILNSLTPVTSLAEIAASAVAEVEWPGPDPQLEKARAATAALARRAAELERFVASYRSFSEAPVLRPAPIDIATWLTDLVELFRASPAGRDAEVALTLPPVAPALTGDVGLLSQVVLNLLKNAGEAAADSSPPRVAIDVVAEDVSAGEAQVRITVSDNGPGIPETLVREVFLPFFTTKRDGTGIGLSFARQVVLLHGGRISAAPGPGGRITIALAGA